jgi:hypothetical protein
VTASALERIQENFSKPCRGQLYEACRGVNPPVIGALVRRYQIARHWQASAMAVALQYDSFCSERPEPLPLAFAHRIGSSSLFSRASSPIRVFRCERDLLWAAFTHGNLIYRLACRRWCGNYRTVCLPPALLPDWLQSSIFVSKALVPLDPRGREGHTAVTDQLVAGMIAATRCTGFPDQ